jgi:hypothetical protein
MTISVVVYKIPYQKVKRSGLSDLSSNTAPFRKQYVFDYGIKGETNSTVVTILVRLLFFYLFWSGLKTGVELFIKYVFPIITENNF